MPAPYDYTLKGESPIMAGLKGFDIAQQQRQRAMYMDQQRAAMEEQQRQRERQQQYRQDLMALTDNPFSSAEDYIKLQSTYPEAMEAIKQVQQGRSKEQLQGDVEQIQKVGSALAAGKNDIAKQQVMNYRNALENSGRGNEVQSMDNILEMMDENPGVVSAELNKYLLAQMGPEAFTDYFKQIQMGAGQTRAIRSETYPDGTSLKVMNIGPPEIWSPTGEKLTGQAAADAILKAQEYGSELAKKINFNRETGKLEGQKDLKATIEGQVQSAKEAEKKRTEFFNQYQTIQENILTLDEGIAIIEKGLAEGKDLGLGPIRKYFPAWGATAQRLKNVTDRMGLDVVSSVTFGALSEGELKMALRTAKPPDLKGRDLVQWMRDRKSAQEKLAAYLSEAANFIGSPKEGGGINTVADWMQIVESKKRQRTEAPENLKQQSRGDLFNRLIEIRKK